MRLTSIESIVQLGKTTGNEEVKLMIATKLTNNNRGFCSHNGQGAEQKTYKFKVKHPRDAGYKPSGSNGSFVSF